jgi:hypothetical protein
MVEAAADAEVEDGDSIFVIPSEMKNLGQSAGI